MSTSVPPISPRGLFGIIMIQSVLLLALMYKKERNSAPPPNSDVSAAVGLDAEFRSMAHGTEGLESRSILGEIVYEAIANTTRDIVSRMAYVAIANTTQDILKEIAYEVVTRTKGDVLKEIAKGVVTNSTRKVLRKMAFGVLSRNTEDMVRESNAIVHAALNDVTRTVVRAAPSTIVVPEIPAGDIKICVAIRTNHKQAAELMVTIGSIINQKAEGVSLKNIMIINTDPSPNPPSGYRSWESLVAGFHDLRVSMSPVKAFRENTYGYRECDAHLRQVILPSDCDYVMFTNGENYYRPGTFEAAAENMKLGYSIIGMNFLTTRRHQIYGGVKMCQFKHSFVDIGSVFMKVDNIRQLGTTFEENKLPCPGPEEELEEQNCLAVDLRPYWAADWGFIQDLGKRAPNQQKSFICNSDVSAFLVAN
ncbi:hypothetical protein AAMO2058_001403600 [Amorphochlora amoebiformis]